MVHDMHLPAVPTEAGAPRSKAQGAAGGWSAAVVTALCIVRLKMSAWACACDAVVGNVAHMVIKRTWRTRWGVPRCAQRVPHAVMVRGVSPCSTDLTSNGNGVEGGVGEDAGDEIDWEVRQRGGGGRLATLQHVINRDLRPVSLVRPTQ